MMQLYKIFLSKNLIANSAEVMYLIVINRNKYPAIFCEQVSCNFQSGINHVQPIGMETTVGVGILFKTSSK